MKKLIILFLLLSLYEYNSHKSIYLRLKISKKSKNTMDFAP